MNNETRDTTINESNDFASMCKEHDVLKKELDELNIRMRQIASKFIRSTFSYI